MGHMIQCFIGEPIIIKTIISPLEQVSPVIIDLPQGLQCLFLCDNIFNAIHKYINADINNKIEPFDFLDQSIKNYLENIQFDGCFIYIETEYFGGVGVQVSGIFKNGQLLTTYKESPADIDVTIPYPNRLLELPINKSLRYIGVIREDQLDEFDTLRLGNYRNMPYNEI